MLKDLFHSAALEINQPKVTFRALLSEKSFKVISAGAAKYNEILKRYENKWSGLFYEARTTIKNVYRRV